MPTVSNASVTTVTICDVGTQGNPAVTSSWAFNAISASYAVTASFVAGATTVSASYANRADTASYAETANVNPGIFFQTSSYYATTNNIHVTGSTLLSGSLTLPVLATNNHLLQINNSGIISTIATASWAVNAVTASFLLGSIESASFAQTASLARTASYSNAVEFPNILNKPTLFSASAQVNLSQAFETASWADNAVTASFVATASWSNNAVTASHALDALFMVAVSDETTDLTTGSAKITYRTPYSLDVIEVRSNVNTAPSGSDLIVDINNGVGDTILSGICKLVIDSEEKTSLTSLTSSVIIPASRSFANDEEITIDIDQTGSIVPGKGLKVYIIGNRT